MSLYPYKQSKQRLITSFLRRNRSRLPGTLGRQGSRACIDAALEQSDGAIHADGDIAAREVKASRNLLVRESLVETQFDDLAAGSRQQIDHLLEQDKQFSFPGQSLGIRGPGSLATVLAWPHRAKVFQCNLDIEPLGASEFLKVVHHLLDQGGKRGDQGGHVA